MGSRPTEATRSFPPQQPMPPAANFRSLSQQAYPPPDPNLAPTAPLSEDEHLPQKKRRGRPGPGGCILLLIAVLVLLSGTLAGVWFFALQPYVHNMVIDKLDTAMGQAVDQIPPLSQSPLPFPLPAPQQDKQLPPITETLLNNVMKLSLSPSEPVKDPSFHITEQNVRMEFNVQPDFLPFGIPCAISFVPTVDDQGNVIVSHVNIEGMANLIVTSNDITPILNRHLKDAMTKLNNPVSSIQLQQGTIVVRLK
jgi:hypothetical protein